MFLSYLLYPLSYFAHQPPSSLTLRDTRNDLYTTSWLMEAKTGFEPALSYVD